MVDKAEKKTRGNGPVTVSYVDGEGNAHKRIPDKGVVGVQVTDKAGKSKIFKLSEYTPAMINGLAAAGLAKKLDVFVRNTVKNDDSADVLGTAGTIHDLVKNGKLYTRAEGTGKAASKFDFDFWVSVMTEAAQLQEQPLTKKKVDSLHATLNGVQGRERNAILLKWQKNPVVKSVLMKRKLEQAKKDAKSGAGSVSDLF